MAVTIFGGLISATLLDTLLTPVLFLALRPQAAGAALGRCTLVDKLGGHILACRDVLTTRERRVACI